MDTEDALNSHNFGGDTFPQNNVPGDIKTYLTNYNALQEQHHTIQQEYNTMEQPDEIWTGDVELPLNNTKASASSELCCGDEKVMSTDGDCDDYFQDLLDILKEDQNVAARFQLRACVYCRQRHVKCDRLLPCTRCTQDGVECIPQETKNVKKRATSEHNNVSQQSLDAAKLKRIKGISSTTRQLLKQKTTPNDYYSVRAYNVFDSGEKLCFPFARCAMKIMFDSAFSYELDKLHDIFRQKPNSMVEGVPVAEAMFMYGDERQWWNLNFCKLVKGTKKSGIDLFGEVLAGSENAEYLRMREMLRNAKLDFLCLMYIFSFEHSAEEFQITTKHNKPIFWNQRIIVDKKKVFHKNKNQTNQAVNGDGLEHIERECADELLCADDEPCLVDVSETRILRIGKSAVLDPLTRQTVAKFQFQDITEFYPSWAHALDSLTDFTSQLEPGC